MAVKSWRACGFNSLNSEVNWGDIDVTGVCVFTASGQRPGWDWSHKGVYESAYEFWEGSSRRWCSGYVWTHSVCVCRCGFGCPEAFVSARSLEACGRAGENSCTDEPHHNRIIFGTMLGNRWKGKLRGGPSQKHTLKARSFKGPGGGAKHCGFGAFWPPSQHCQEFLQISQTLQCFFLRSLSLLSIFF